MQSNTVYPVQVYNPVDSFQEYTKRSDTVTLSAGNAQAVNSRIHTIDPWPKNVGNTRIAADGARMSNSVWRYRCEKPAPSPLPTLSTSETSSSGAVAAAAGVTRGAGDCQTLTGPATAR